MCRNKSFVVIALTLLINEKSLPEQAKFKYLAQLRSLLKKKDMHFRTFK